MNFLTVPADFKVMFQIDGAPDARDVRWRFLHPRSDPRLANPRGVVVRLSLSLSLFDFFSKFGRVPLLDAEKRVVDLSFGLYVACC